MKKRIGALFMAVILVCCLMPKTTAKADDSDIALQWNYITLINGSVNISKGGVATVQGTGQAAEASVTKVYVKVSLQQYKSNKWTEIASWNSTTNGKVSTIGTKSKAVAHGYSYRIVITTKAYKGSSVLETATKTINYGYFS